MFAWALYAICISLCLGLAAAAAERVHRLRRRPTRWVWLGALFAALVVPALISFVAIEIPRYDGANSETVVVRLRETTAQGLAPERWVADVDAVNTPDADATFARAWLCSTLAVILMLAVLSVHWVRRARSWERTELLGEDVYIAENVGPAVVGFFRPRIVVPRWLLSSPPQAIGSVLAHERQHIESRDPQLLLASLAFICAMPWNLPLWWAVARLRRAIEIDCDARVLRDGRDPADYGSVLLDIHQRRAHSALAVVALTERHSFLETRVRLLFTTRGVRWRWIVTMLTVACVAMVALAAHISPPSFFVSQRSVAISDVAFDRVAGYYHFGGQMVMRVARDGQRRFVHLAGQRAWPISARTTRRWVSQAPFGEYEFTLNEQGVAMQLAFRQNGNDYTGRRVSAATGQELQRAFAARVRLQTPTTGSADAVRRIVTELQAGRFDERQLMPGLAARLQDDLDGRSAELRSFGAMQAITFTAVTSGGSDVFKVDFERGSDEVTIRLAPDGRVQRLSFDEWRSVPQRDALAARFQRQEASAGSAAALQRLIEGVRVGKPDYEELSPGMGEVVRQQLASLQLGVASFGELQSITFDRVAPNGWDVFSVRFDHAVIACSIELRQDGKVSGVLWDM